MKVNIEQIGSSLKININDEIEEYHNEFDFSKQNNLTNFVMAVSDMTQELEIEPIDYDTFKELHSDSDKQFQIAKYIYDILNAFNTSYVEVFNN